MVANKYTAETSLKPRPDNVKGTKEANVSKVLNIIIYIMLILMSNAKNNI